MTIHAFGDNGGVDIWTDCEPGHDHSGRCIGQGATLAEAKADARRELENDLLEIDALTPTDVEPVAI